MGCCGLGVDHERREGVHNLHGFEADGDYLPDETDDVFGIVGAVRVVNDAAAFVGRNLVLVNHPFQRGAIAQSIFVGRGRNALQGKKVVVDERGLVFAQSHLHPRAN